MSLFQSNLRKTNQKFAENSEFCENYSLLFKIIHWCPYSQVQRAWEKSATLSDTAKALAAKGVAKAREGESPKARKRRAMAGCSMDECRKQAGFASAAECTQQVLDGNMSAILQVAESGRRPSGAAS